MAQRDPRSSHPPLTLTLARSVLHRLAGLLGVDASRISRGDLCALGVGLLLLFASLGISASDARQYGGIDLRNRVVGARVALQQRNPYFYVWRQGDPVELLDPLDRNPRRPRLTAPPTALLLYAPFSWIDYPLQRMLWWGIEWGALLLSLRLLAGTLPSQRSRARFIALGLWFFATSSFWRLHLERGQLYVYHLLMLAGIASLWLRGRYDSWASGVLLGALIAIRPVFGTLAVAALSSRWWKTSLGSLAGFAAVVALTLPMLGVNGWRGYLASVRSYDDLSISMGRAAANKPTIAEGYDFARHLRTAPQLSVKQLAERYDLRRMGITSDQLARSGAVACVLAVGLIGLISAGRRPGRATVGLFFTIAVLTEYFMPVRWPYVNIVWLLPLACIAPFYALRSRMALVVSTILLFGLFAGHTLFGIAPSLGRDLIRTATLIAASLPPLALIAWASVRRS